MESTARSDRSDRDAPVDPAAALIAVAEGLTRELHPDRQLRRRDLDASLDQDWGFDSLSRAELLLRIERQFAVSLPERLVLQAESLRDILAALPTAKNLAAAAPVSPAMAPTGVEPAAETAATLIEVLDWHALRHGDQDHLIIESGDETRRISYAGLAESARRVAAGLRQRDVSPGDRIAIMLPTSAAFFLAFFGALYAGAVPVPFYPPARPAQIGEHLRRQAGILRNAGAVVLIASEEARPLSRLLRMHVESIRHVETVEALSAGDAGSRPRSDASQTALLQYTSGSTGDPKGVVLSHANLLANIRAMGAVIRPTASDVFVSWLPLYHDMGLIGAWLGSLHYGVPLVVMPPERFLLRPDRWLWAIARYRGTLTAAPNFAFEFCLRKIEDSALEGLDLGSLRMVANGAEPVSPDTIRRFAARFEPYGFQPGAMAPVYGLAENAVGLAFPPIGRLPIIDRVDRQSLRFEGKAVPAASDQADAVEIVACGRALPGHQVRIVGPTGELPERQEGRLQFRGPSACRGYFQNPEKDRELFEGPWLNSGDLAYLAAGDVYVTGRSKDIIIRAGQHLHPQEIEEAVGNVPGIRKGCVAVFGGADPQAGTERLVVVAETRETAPAKVEGLRATVAQTTARLVQAPPDEVVLVPPRVVPKTSSGKIRRAAARQMHRQGAFTEPRASPRAQLFRLGLSGVASSLRQLKRGMFEIAYAAYWWLAVGLLGSVAWLLVLVIPGRARRWTALHALARLLLFVLRIPVSVNRKRPPPASAVIASNHSSYIDGVVLAAVLPGELCFVAKQELAGQLVAGLFLRALGTLFVERNDPTASVAGERAVFEAVRAGRRVVMFPEGTFHRGPGLLPFHLGAFTIAARAAVPILPVAISGTRSILRGEQWFPRQGQVTVTIGAEIRPDGSDFGAALRLRDATRAAILSTCGEPELLET